MIISGYKKDDNTDKIINEISEKDQIIADKLQSGELITESDIEDARKRLEQISDIRKDDIIEDAKDPQKWDFLESLKEHPLYHKRGRNRAFGALKIIEDNVPFYKGYLIPGQLVWFRYDDPATKDKLDWFDRTPCVIFFGYTKNAQGKIRELGFNLHYFPPFTRKNIMQRIFRLFKEHFIEHFNEPTDKPISGISYLRLLGSLRSAKLDVGIREYIPGLRALTRVIPTKYFPDACLTEGVWDGATARQVFNYWKTFKK